VRNLALVDWVVVGLYLLLVMTAGVVLTRRAGRSVEDFFVGGRGMSWWLLGISMAATNFSIDTPIAITRLVADEGVAGVWFFWASAISALLVTFLFSRLWQRSQVLTDAELIELRYGGSSAAALRLIKGLYFGVLFNAFIMGWVFLALIKVVSGLTDISLPVLLVATTAIVLAYSLASGFYGVVMTDLVQYIVALAGSIVLAAFAVTKVGGLGALTARIESQLGAGTLAFVPDLSLDNVGPLSVFLTYVLVQWWAHKYSDGGGKHIQRMLAARSERDAFRASLFFSVMNYAVQVWPWILTALAGLVLLGRPDDPETIYAGVMAAVLPPGVLGLVFVGLVGAFMSTIDTHLNLGASYMVNDIYRRFLVRGASERHYVLMSRVMMAALLAISVAIALQMGSVAGAWKFLLTFASGAGLTWVVRWFWWRVNAWTEISAMVTSGVVATWIELVHGDWLYSAKLCTTVAVTTVVWLVVTFATPAVDRLTLLEFVRRIRPGSPGWRHLDSGEAGAASGFLGPALLCWLAALVAFFGLNFGLGSVLLQRHQQAVALLSLALIAGAATAWLVWKSERSSRPANRIPAAEIADSTHGVDL